MAWKQITALFSSRRRPPMEAIRDHFVSEREAVRRALVAARDDVAYYEARLAKLDEIVAATQEAVAYADTMDKLEAEKAALK